MPNDEQSVMYSEVYQILEILGDEYKGLIPGELYNVINQNRIIDYNSNIRADIPLSEQKIGKKTVAFLCMLHSKYWCNDAKEKEVINKILENNEIEKRKEDFKYQETFGRTRTKENISNALVVNNSFIKRVIQRIKKIFSF